MADSPTGNPYDRYYFQHYAGGAYQRTPRWLQFFDFIAENIVREINPRTVLDAGCAMGFLVEALRRGGVEAYGIDVSEYAIQQVAADIRPYCRQASILDPLPRRYDLVVSIEVVEHLTAGDGAAALRNLCETTDDFLFSSTPLGYRETTHLNVQPLEYWAGLFGSNGFVRDVDCDASFVAPWAVRFRRHRGPIHEALRDYERKCWSLLRENQELRSLSLEMQGQLATDEHVVDTLAGDMLDREQQIWMLHGYLEAKDTYIESLVAHVRAKEQVIAELDGAVRASDASLESLTTRMTAVERSNAELESSRRALSNQLSTLKNSRAWRTARRLERLNGRLAPPRSLRRRAAAKALRMVRAARLPRVEDSPPRTASEAVPSAARDVHPDQPPDGHSAGLPAPVESGESGDHSAASLANLASSPPDVLRVGSGTAPRTNDRVLIVNGSMGDMERYRCHHAREQLALSGIACEICDLSDPRLRSLAPDATVLILHRMQWGPLVNELVATARSKKNVTVLYDIDDLIFKSEVEAQIQALQLGNPIEQVMFRTGIRRYRQALEACDGILGASETIAREARALGKPAWVHRNALSQEMIDLSDAARRRRSEPNGKVVIGYASGTRTHNKDFAQAEEALENILQAYTNTELRIVGPLDLHPRWDKWAGRITRIPFLPWRELPEALAQFDINLAPLEIGNVFCAAKSELKYFEAAAVGIPTVASRWGSFVEAIRIGDNGFLADSTLEWFQALQQLVTDPQLRRQMGERARLDAVERYSPAVRAPSLVNIFREAGAVRDQARSDEAKTPGRPFPEHRLAHRFLDGLTGLEIGAAAHNPFGLRTRNIAPKDDYEFYAEESRKVMGMAPAPVDLFAYADELPVQAECEDFVLSSHVVEHLPNLVKAFQEWDRVVRNNGYIFMIVPLKGALPADEPRDLTPLEHFIDDYRTGVTVHTHGLEGVPGGKMGHYHTFTPDTLLALVAWMKVSSICEWDLVAREDIDSKVGNGFTLVFRVRHHRRTDLVS